MTIPRDPLRSYIHGEAMPAENSKCFDIYNPGTGKVCYQAESADEAVLEKALASAQAGLRLLSL